jgi:biopolymer transport protein ExbD
VKIAGQTVPTHQLRGFLQSYLADKRGQPVVIDADPTTPYSAVAGVLDAARDNGAKSARIRGAAER